MKRVTGWASVVIGVVVAVLGITLMLMLGPDNRIITGPHAIDTDGTVVVTAPRAIRWTGVQLDVLAELPAQKPVFVGLGNTVDVQSLVSDTQRVEVSTFGAPWKPTFRTRDGRAVVQGAPTALDWWYADSAGLGGASISTELPDDPVSLAVISVGASNLTGLRVTLGYGIRGGFAKGTGLLLLGAGAVIGGLVLRRSGEPDDQDRPDEDGPDEDGPDEGVVYLIVDEDGVERELTAAEVDAGGYEVVEEEIDPVDDVVTPQPGPTTPATGEPVVYVYVDDDGVEHEVGEDELDLTEFEIVDEGDEPGDGGAQR